MTRAILLLMVTLTLAGQGMTGQQFEGKRVKVLLDMPADDSGVELRARAASPLNEIEHRSHLVKYGVGVRRGQVVSVTLVKVKGDHIEFQLAGGGFTNKQFLSLPSFDSPRWGTSPEERRIQSSMFGTRDEKRRKRLKSEYDSIRYQRVRPLRDKLERELREEAGSRFNIRFSTEREASRVTAEELAAILKPYAELQ